MFVHSFFSCMLTRRAAFSLLYLDQLDPCSSQAMGRTGIVRTGKTTKEKKQPVARSPEAAASAAAPEHYAVLSASRSTSSSERLRLSCGHFFDDLREECSVCQKHYADRDANMRQRHT